MLDQEINEDLNQANKMIEDADIVSKHDFRKIYDTEEITDAKIIQNLPKLGTNKSKSDRCFSEFLDSFTNQWIFSFIFTELTILIQKANIFAVLKYL